MSEFLAEASVLIQANTRLFRAELAAALATVPKAIEIPIVAVGSGSATSVRRAAAAASEELALATSTSTAAFNEEAVAATRAGSSVKRKAAADAGAAAAARANAKLRREITQGFTAQAASAAGLRGQLIGANAAFLAATATAIAFGKSIQSVVSFERSLNVFRATTGATADDLDRVSKAAKQLGADVTLPSVNAQDAADAMLELSKAGLSVEQSMAAARGVLQLATAASIDNAQATELAASALNAFGLAGDDATHVADVLANAANASQGSIVDIGIALRQAATVGRQAGLSLEQVTGVLTLFARNGLVGSDAGTALRTMLLRLINPTKKASELMGDLGLNIRTATGQIDLGVFDQFTRATQNMTKAQRDRDLAIIFGQDAIRGAAIVTREGNAALASQTKELGKAGTAQEVAAARTQGLAGSFENMKNQAATLGLTLGEVSEGPVKVFITGLGNMFESANKIASTIGAISKGVGRFLNGEQFDVATANFDQLSTEAAKFQDQLSQGGDEFAPALITGLQTVANALAASGAKLAKQGFLTRVVQEFVQLSPQVKSAMEDNVITPAERAELQATALGRAFLTAIDSTKQFGVSSAAGAKSGIESASAAVREGAPRLGQAMKDTVEEASAQAKVAADQGGTETGDAFIDAVRRTQGAVRDLFQAATRQDRLRSGAQQSNLIDIQFQGGGAQQRLAGLKKLLASQREIVSDLQDQGATRKKIDAAKNDAIATQNDIESTQQEITSAAEAAANKVEKAAREREAAARKIQQANDKADQAVLDSFARGQNRIDLSAISANATDRLSDNIKLQDLIISTAQREQKVIEDTVKDVKLRNAQIAQRVQTIAAARAERDRLIKQAADDLTQRRADAFQAQVDLAAAQGNVPAQIRFITIRIRSIDKLIAAGKQEGAALNRLKTERAQLRQQREDVQNQQVQDQIALGQSILDLTGNQSPLVKALDAAIAETKQDIAVAKKAGRSTVALQTELNNFLKQRKDLVDGLNDQSGLSVAGFLAQNNELFKSIASNLGDVGKDPFSGFDFSSSIVKTLTRLQSAAPGSAGGRGNVLPTLTPGVSKPIDASIQKLIDALDRNTNAKDGNASTGQGLNTQARMEVGGRFPVAANSRFWENRLARQQVEDNI